MALDHSVIPNLTMAMIEQLETELDLDEADLLAAMVIVAIRPDPKNRPGWVQYRHFSTVHSFHENIGILNATQLGMVNQAAGGG